MLMTAAVRMDSTTTSPTPPPWFPVPPAGNHRLPYDYDGFTAPAPSPTPAAAAAPPNHHLRPEPTTRRASAASKRRRPRPSRKLPTTYITADDPASFRRMVHQVTGADDNLPAADAPPPPPAAAPLETLCCRPAPYRTPGAVILPTLDTSAFLIGAPAPGLDRRMEAGGGGGGGACNNYSSNSNSGSSCGGGGGGFPTLDDVVTHSLSFIRAPPVTFPRVDGKVKKIELPEDVYVQKFFKKHPDSLYHDAIKISGFDPPPARVFAWRVLELKEQGVSEDYAMAVADFEYRKEKKAKRKAYKELKAIARSEGKEPPPNPYPSAIKEIQAEEKQYVMDRFCNPKVIEIANKMKEERETMLRDRAASGQW